MSKPHEGPQYDPAVLEMQRSLQLAKSTGAAEEVIKSIQNALDLVEMREQFSLYATSKDSEACENIEDATYSHDWEDVHKQGKAERVLHTAMLSGRLEGQFLKALVSMQKAKRVLDVGMYTGYSSLSMAEALPADGEVITLDKVDYLKTLVTNLHSKSPHHKKIKIKIGNALESMRELAANNQQFDIMFLDADKSEYLDYLKLAFEGNLLAPGGTVLVDNAFMRGSGYMPSGANSATKKFADAVAADSSLHSVMVPMRDGVMMIRRMSDVIGATA